MPMSIETGSRDEATGIYVRQALTQVNRVLSWGDRESFSTTFGCFDRTYWSWKFSDFPGARFQEAVYLLAHLFTHRYEGNVLFEDPRVLKWIRAGLDYWTRIQYPDGSFDEAYPFERSLAATAFTAFYLGESYLLVRDDLEPAEKERLEQAFVAAGEWLCRNDESHGVLSNHLAAAAAAILTIHRITSRQEFRGRMMYFLRRIYDHQSDEGWYEEYGGADPGYQTHGTFYLAWIWRATKDAELLESLLRSVRFISHFIHPDRTLGGEYGSRNTEFYFPAGFEILAEVSPEAAMIAEYMRPAVDRQSAVGVSAMDAFNLLPLANNYLFAARVADLPACEPVALPCMRTGEFCFPDAGLLVRSTEQLYVVVGISKGGVVKVFDQDQGLVLSDCGYFAQSEKGAVASSQSLAREREWDVTEGMITIDAPFMQVNQRKPSPELFLAFRIFSLTLGRFGAVAFWLKRQLVRVLVSRRRSAELRLVRRIHLAADLVRIIDTIEATGRIRLRELRRDSAFATIHMGSSRYFQEQELGARRIDELDYAADLNRTGSVQITADLHVGREQ